MELIIKSLIISLFCVGLRMVSSKGMILYFLRIPYEYLVNRKELALKMIKRYSDSIDSWHKSGGNEEFKRFTIKKLNEQIKYERKHFKKEWLIYFLKPIIGCTTCMASVWTIAIDYFYFERLNKWTILLIFMVACLNSIFYEIYEKLKK